VVKTKTVQEVSRAEKGSAACVSVVVSFRCSQEERRAMQEKAEEAGLSLGEWAREALSEAKAGQGEQGELPFEEEEGEEDRAERAREAAHFVEQVKRSAEGLARGWLNAKLLPKANRRRSRLEAELTREEETEGLTE